MQLTNGGFITALTVAAIGVTGATVWLLPKVSGRGVRAVAARLGLLTVCQVSILLAIMAGLNSYFLFYLTWGDLLGTNNSKVRVQARGQGGGAGSGQPLPHLVSRLGLDQGLRAKDRDGELQELTINGPRTGLRATAFVYLPPQYFQSAYANKRFPVALVLTGWPGDPRAILKRQGLLKMIAQDTKTGRIQPTIYVTVRTTVLPPRDTECTDVPGGPQVMTFFSQDVPDALRTTYRTATGLRGWGLMGQSTGGYCAAKIAMTNSDRFAIAASMAGYFRALKDPTTGDLYGGSDAVRNSNDLIWRIRNLPPPPISLLVASSKGGEPNFPQAQQFIAAAKPPLQVTTALLDEGGHNFGTFEQLWPDTMHWMDKQLKAD